MIEMNVAIICACLPMCRLPLAYLFPATLGSTAKSSDFGGSSGSSNARSTVCSGCKSRDGPRAHPGGGGARDEEEKGAQSGYRLEIVRRTSEEIMLRPLSAITARIDDVAEQADEVVGQRRPGASRRDSGIRKTTWFEISCDDERPVPGRAM
jgi:hypothetical protein